MSAAGIFGVVYALVVVAGFVAHLVWEFTRRDE
jgi:hypothetical protein